VEGEEKKDKDSTKGFAGLTSMVSDVVSDSDRAAQRAQPLTRATAPPVEQSGAAATRDGNDQSSEPRPYQAPPQATGGSSGGKWVVGIAAIIGLLWLVSESGNKSSPPVPANAPSFEPRTTATPSPAWPPPAAAPQTPSRPSEDRPPAGTAIVLNAAQIRYCLAEDIRMTAAKAVISGYNEADTDRFNGMVADYNARCGSFKYRRGALESARTEVEIHRTELEVEGRSRFARSTSSVEPQTPSAVTARLPDATVQAIQEGLNAAGYDAGEADGLVGGKTRSAIAEFQRDHGMAIDAEASVQLLRQIQRPPQRANVASTPTPDASLQDSKVPPNSFVSGSQWYCNQGFRKVGNTCEQVQAPANSFISGSEWYCNQGFRKAGGSCEKVQSPPNSFISGAEWYCNQGFRKVGSSCEQVQAPPNSFISGAEWYCNQGFRKVGNSCERVQAPANSFVSGAEWYCNQGFRKVGDRCDPL